MSSVVKTGDARGLVVFKLMVAVYYRISVSGDGRVTPSGTLAATFSAAACNSQRIPSRSLVVFRLTGSYS